jgi:predicted NBD/HSP70 family sugar kinase
LSGRGFERRANAQLGLSGQEMLSGAELARRARDGDRVVKGFFEEYADLLAITIHNFVMLYAPEVVVLAGSFANASDLYLEASRSKLETLLVRRRQGIDFMPQLRVSSLENRAGVLGGAYIALNAALN